MGVQADNAQIGQSGTNSQNFNIRAPLDGTLRLSRGGKGVEISDPVRVNADNSVTLLGDLTLGGNLLSGGFGLGQTWQLMTASRALNTIFTNTTGKAIMIMVSAQSNTTAQMQISMGVTHQGNTQSTVGALLTHTSIVPAGAAYSAQISAGAASGLNWWELR